MHPSKSQRVDFYLENGETVHSITQFEVDKIGSQLVPKTP
jgi:hypothetical protein